MHLVHVCFVYIQMYLTQNYTLIIVKNPTYPFVTLNVTMQNIDDK